MVLQLLRGDHVENAVLVEDVVSDGTNTTGLLPNNKGKRNVRQMGYLRNHPEW